MTNANKKKLAKLKAQIEKIEADPLNRIDSSDIKEFNRLSDACKVTETIRCKIEFDVKLCADILNEQDIDTEVRSIKIVRSENISKQDARYLTDSLDSLSLINSSFKKLLKKRFKDLSSFVKKISKKYEIDNAWELFWEK